MALLRFLFQTGSIKRIIIISKIYISLSFYSKLVRLKVDCVNDPAVRCEEFLFQTGSIKSL